MDIEIKKDRSIYYWLVDLFADTPFVKILDSFTMEGLIITCISVDYETITSYDFEMGTRARARKSSWSIDVFAADKNQRDSFAFRILTALDQKITVYDYDVGFPPSVTPPKIGCLEPDNVRLSIIKVFPDLTENMYYRANIYFLAEFSN